MMDFEPFNFDDMPLTGWYPGHMKKANKQMQEALKLIDIVVEVCDARAPLTTRNPAFHFLFQHKPRLMLFNKADLADAESTQKWREWYAQRGIDVVAMSATKLRQVSELAECWKRTFERVRAERGATQPLHRAVRVLISGVPNVGKSTIINKLSVERRAEVGNQPGVTRTIQWIPIAGGVELLDTPGVLWPKIKKKTQELRLALCGCIKDEVVGVELLAEFLLVELKRLGIAWPFALYGIQNEECDEYDFIEQAGRKRGMLRSGGKVDRERISSVMLRDFREGKFGKITFELPSVTEEEEQADGCTILS